MNKNKINLESAADIKAYKSFLEKAEKEVDSWPTERKLRRATSFSDVLSEKAERQKGKSEIAGQPNPEKE